jgi:hypothetical protein
MEEFFAQMIGAEHERARARAGASIKQNLLCEARETPKPILLAVIVLALPNAERRLVSASPEYGDDDGLNCAKSYVRELASAIVAGEVLRLELREVPLVTTRLLSAADVEHYVADWQARMTVLGEHDDLHYAREAADKLVLCLNVLVLADGERRIPYYGVERGDGAGLEDAQRLDREFRMTPLLLRDERFEIELRECSLDGTQLVEFVPF